MHAHEDAQLRAPALRVRIRAECCDRGSRQRCLLLGQCQAVDVAGVEEPLRQHRRLLGCSRGDRAGSSDLLRTCCVVPGNFHVACQADQFAGRALLRLRQRTRGEARAGRQQQHIGEALGDATSDLCTAAGGLQPAIDKGWVGDTSGGFQIGT